MSKALSLPDPQRVTLAQVPEIALQAQEIRDQIEQSGDGDTALELHHRLEALGKYLADKDAAATIAGETRLTEVLIGKLLGPAEVGANQHGGVTSWNGSVIPRVDRHRFRELAEHEAEVQELIAQGVVKRAALLRELNGGETVRLEPCPTCGKPMRADKPARGAR